MRLNQLLKSSLVLLGIVGLAFGQADWYHQREDYFHGNWHGHVFGQVRQDLDHIYTAGAAAEKEQHRLERTKQELDGLQAKLDQGVWDNGTVNDVIDSLRKSANDQRLGPQDRQVLADDAARIHEFQRHHNEWIKH